MTSTAPGAWAGVVAVIVVALTTLTPAAAVPPKVTLAPLTKFVPVMVTAVKPVSMPLLGATLVTVGAQPVGSEAASEVISAALNARL